LQKQSNQALKSLRLRIENNTNTDLPCRTICWWCWC